MTGRPEPRVEDHELRHPSASMIDPGSEGGSMTAESFVLSLWGVRYQART